MTVERVNCDTTTGYVHWFHLGENGDSTDPRILVLDVYEPPEVSWVDDQPILSGVDCETVFQWDAEAILINGCKAS